MGTTGFIVGILLAIVGIVYLCIIKQKKFIPLVLLISIIITGFSCAGWIEEGYVGVPVTLGRAGSSAYGSGLYFVTPLTNIVKMDTRQHAIEFSMQAFSADFQEVDLKGTLVYNLTKGAAVNVYKTVGLNYEEVIVKPRLIEDIKNVFAEHTAESIIENRETLPIAAADLLRADIEKQGFNVSSISIKDIDFSDAFTSAVEAKQVATQEKLREEIQQQQQTMMAEQAAERQRIAAQAEADVARIQAEAEAYAVEVNAEAQAEANKKLATSITQNLIDYTYANNWDGELPSTILGDNIPIIWDAQN